MRKKKGGSVLPQEYHFLFATFVFLLTYAFIVAEKWHRAVVAISGAVIILLSKVLTQDVAIGFIDFNTIGLLIGMMIIVGVTRETGVFEYMAILAAKKAKGEPVRIMIFLAIITAIASALLDNVTTVLLIVPVTFSIVRELKLSPIPFLITEIIASNIGGTATLIGDPPNIMIGSATHLTFLDFLFNLTPVIVVIFIVTIYILKWIYKKQLQIDDSLKENIMKFDENEQIKDVKLLKKCLAVLALTIL
ncbi:MAG TPA: SLC13 family permease, partial [Clostridia bacterium]|nr:SLC13 family permease [Clostridia bacterium]